MAEAELFDGECLFVGVSAIIMVLTGVLTARPKQGRRRGERRCGDPTCGHVNPAQARFCAQCGRPLRRRRR